MSSYDDLFRISSTRLLAVNSGSGAVATTAALSSQIYAIDIVAVSTVTSASGVRFQISEVANVNVTSTLGALLPVNWLARYKVSPGQVVAAVSNDGNAQSLTIIELTK